MTGRFAAASAVRSVGDGRYAGEVAEGWDLAGVANGGYLTSMAARALSERTGRPDPVTVTTHFLAPARPGPVTIDTDVVRAGRRFATARATLADDTRPLLTVLGTFGELPSGTDDGERLVVDGAPPPLPDPDECFLMDPANASVPAIFSKVEIRLHPDDAGFAAGSPPGAARMRGWFRLPDGEELTSTALLLVVDAFPPTVFNAALPVAWTPTVELTTHVRARPAPGWLAASFRSRFVTDGFLEADGEVWDGTGRLVAQSRQLALVPRG